MRGHGIVQFFTRSKNTAEAGDMNQLRYSNPWPQLTPDEASVIRLCSMELYQVGSETETDGNGQLEGKGSEDVFYL